MLFRSSASLFLAFNVVAVTLPAQGQATRPTTDAAVVSNSPAAAVAPADTEWPRTLATFAKSLAAGDAASVEAALSSRATVRRFDGVAGAEPSRMSQRLAKSVVLGQHAYLHPPLVMAADVAADFKNAVGIPDKAKERFQIDDEQEIKRANATAVQWVVEQLSVRGGTPVGVIVLWAPRAGPNGAAGEGFEVTFVLCRGEEVAPREFKINAVVYGVPVTENP